ncbi:hypothetical protein ABZV31_28780 [Streptomyces sp. NPDC005202]|uniref:hypothetical protein n=1 Tax=Streptomyces sp. NPDC005202 TaxID=3157021 RepID=UPI0033A98A09
MHSNEEPSRASGGLSTEDLAQPSGGTAASTREAEGAASGAPVFPGESTAGEPATTEAATADTSDTSDAETANTAGTAETADTAQTTDEYTPPLLTAEDEQGFRDRWQEIQSKFVDDPREAVHSADTLVADVMQALAATFARHKQDLEGQWSQGEQVDTEDLRKALRRYRSFFNRLLST